MTNDIAYRLNVNSVSQVYSASLPVIILYAIILKKSSVFFILNLAPNGHLT